MKEYKNMHVLYSQGITVSNWKCHENGDTDVDCAGAGFSTAGSPQTQTLAISGLIVDKVYK